MARTPQPCGTPAAFQRHRYHGEPIDDACREAWRAYLNRHRRAQQAAFRGLAKRYPEAFKTLMTEAMAKEAAR